MRFWLAGPRLFRGLVRLGISFGPEDFRPRKPPPRRQLGPPEVLPRVASIPLSCRGGEPVGGAYQYFLDIRNLCRGVPCIALRQYRSNRGGGGRCYNSN